MSEINVEAIRARHLDWYDRDEDEPLTRLDELLYPGGDWGDENRAHYIVREDVPDLIAEIEHLRAQLGGVEVLRADCVSLSRQTNAAGRAYGHVVRRLDDILLASVAGSGGPQ